MGTDANARSCGRCGARLASDNTEPLCRPCQRTARPDSLRPPEVPPEFWDNEQLRDALTRERHIGHAVRSYRRHPFHGRRPIPQEVAARWLNISQAQLARIERGYPVTDLERLIQWAKTLRIPQELLWFTLPSDEPETTASLAAAPRKVMEVIDSATSVSSGKAAGSFVSLLPNIYRGSQEQVFRIDQGTTEDVIDVLSRVQKLHRGTVHPDIIDHLQDHIRRTVARYEGLDHFTLASALVKQRAWIEMLLDECSHPAQRQQLFEIAGTTSGVLGYVAVGRSDFPLARAYCLEAFQLGDFAGNADLQAWARGLQSFCEYYAGRYDEAVTLAKDGLGYAQSGPQSVRLTINGVARAMGKLGDAEEVRRAVDKAYELMSRNDVPGGVPSSISFDCYSAAQTASNAATAYVSLAMPEKVQHYVGLALPEISKSESPWSHSLVLIDLALSLVRAKEVDLDHATALVLDALSISAGRPISSVKQRTLEFARDVRSRWGAVPQASAIADALSAMETDTRVVRGNE